MAGRGSQPRLGGLNPRVRTAGRGSQPRFGGLSPRIGTAGCGSQPRFGGTAGRDSQARISARTREVSVSMANGLVITSMPGGRWPLPIAAFSA